MLHSLRSYLTKFYKITSVLTKEKIYKITKIKSILILPKQFFRVKAMERVRGLHCFVGGQAASIRLSEHFCYPSFD